MVQSPTKRRGEMVQSYRSHRIYIIYIYIWYHKNQAKVGKCTIRGCYGVFVEAKNWDFTMLSFKLFFFFFMSQE